MNQFQAENLDNPAPSQQRILAALRNARLQIEALQQQQKQYQEQQREPIAIIGIGCRFPGGATNPDRFWQMLQNRVDGVTEVPKDRWNVDQFYGSDPDQPGKAYTRYGAFLDQIDQFDPEFFGISPREATAMDPQQRLLLEVSWEALEHGGIAPDRLQGSLTGVFMGMSWEDYAQFSAGDLTQVDAYSSTGTPRSFAAGRLSYVLGFNGPTLFLDTICSSSLLTVHLACQSLRSRECHLALAGGINLMLTPLAMVGCSKLKALATDGRCKTFDARADGYGRGEGCGIVVLKRLSDAIADRDPILACIRGSATNHDGKSNGLTAPNGQAQEAVLRQALANAGVNPLDIQYIEAHGTGTALGDPIEILALDQVLGQNRSAHMPLLVGSVKTNVGHLEAAAGIASLIKVVLALQHQQIPPQLHLQQPNPHISWERLPIKVVTQTQPWPTPLPADQSAPLAGISAFGMSGTNVHTIVQGIAQDATPDLSRPKSLFEPLSESLPKFSTALDRPFQLLPLSAKTATALTDLVARYCQYLNHNPQVDLGDLCHTASVGRSHFPYRLALVTDRVSDLQQQLNAIVSVPISTHQVHERPEPPGVDSGKGSGTIAFLFTGQGSQFVGMAQELYTSQPTFRTIIDRCAEILEPYLEQSLLKILYPSLYGAEPGESEAKIHQTAYTQPALFAIEYALYELWRSWGIEPDMALGHSVGEYVAACVAGVFSLEDGLKLVAARGRLMQQQPQGGGMVSVLATVDQVRAAIEPYPAVEIAAINGPESTVISGSASAIAMAVNQLEATGVKCKSLKVSHAFHSFLMQPILAEFEKVACQVNYAKPQIPLISNITGQIDVTQVATADYWCRHALAPVNFLGAMETLGRQQCQIFLECGPQPILLGLGQQCLIGQRLIGQRLIKQRLIKQQCLRNDGLPSDGLPSDSLPTDGGLWLPSLRSGQTDWQQILISLGRLYTHGISVDWCGFERDYPQRRKISLPTYPFQRQRYWLDTPPCFATQPSITQPPSVHPLLGLPQSAPEGYQRCFTNELSPAKLSWLGEHQVFNYALLPGAAYIELVLAVASSGQIQDLSIDIPVVIDRPTTVQTRLSAQGQIEIGVMVGEEDNQSWQCHGSAQVGSPPQQLSHQRLSHKLPHRLDLQAVRSRCPQPLEPTTLYKHFAQVGLTYGAPFQTLQTIQIGHHEVLAEVKLAPSRSDVTTHYSLSPLLVDGALQALAALEPDKTALYLPIGAATVTVYHPLGQGAIVHGYWHRDKIKSVADLVFCNPDGQILAEIKGLEVRRTHRQALEHLLEATSKASQAVDALRYRIHWQRIELESLTGSRASGVTNIVNHSPGSWLLVREQNTEGCLVESVAQGLQTLGYTVAVTGLNDDARAIDARVTGQIKRLLTNDGEDRDQNSEDQNSSAPCQVVVFSHPTPQVDLATTIAKIDPILKLVQDILAEPSELPMALTLVTHNGIALDPGDGVNPAQSALWGFGRSLQMEQPQLKVRLIDIDMDIEQTDIEQMDRNMGTIDGNRVTENRIIPLLNTLLNKTEPQLLLRGPENFVPRLHRAPLPDQLSVPRTPAMALSIKQRGSLDNLELIPANPIEPQAHEVQVAVRAAGLNFRDVLNVLGAYPGDAGQLGGEIAGVVTGVGSEVEAFGIGDRVCGFSTGGFATYCNSPALLLTKLPSTLDFTRAATLPITFCTAQTALEQLRLKPGEKILIHAAAGGVGLAAIQLAQALGAEIYATASPAKQAYLRQLGIQHLYNSRSTDFAEQILRDTQGHGVDVVLNSLTSEGFIEASLAALTQDGRFFEIGKRDIWTREQMGAVRPDVEYNCLALDHWLVHNPEILQRLLKTITERVETGELQPLKHRIYPLPTAPTAMRYMQQARHVGKLVLTMDQSSIPRQLYGQLHGQCSYLITGGLGALGRQTCGWLGSQGARHIVLVSRTCPSTATEQQLQALEQEYGCEIVVQTTDISDGSQVEQLIQKFGDIWPTLAGIIHAAGTLDDGLIADQTTARFVQVLQPKVQGALNLYSAIQQAQQQAQHLINLDFCIFYSSVTAVLGSAGQSPYATANAFLDGFAQHLRAQGWPAISINWGPWASEGMAATTKVQENLAGRGFNPLTPEQAHRAMVQWLKTGNATGMIVDMDWSRLVRGLGPRTLALFGNLLNQTTPTGTGDHQLLQQLWQSPNSDRQLTLITYLQQAIQQILRLAQPPDPNLAFGDLGMDSLMQLELRNQLQQQWGPVCTLSSRLLTDYPSVNQLAHHLLTQFNSWRQNNPDRSDSPVAISKIGNGTELHNNGNDDSRLSSDTLKNGHSNGHFWIDSGTQIVLEETLRPFQDTVSTAHRIPTAHYCLEDYPEYQDLQQQLQGIEQAGLANPYLVPQTPLVPGVVEVEGRSLISFCAYDYLGFAQDPEIIAAAKTALEQYGTSVSASRIASGERTLHRQLERGLAQFLGVDDCIAYVSGHATNVTTIGHLFDSQDLILYDALSHNSITQGGTLSGATMLAFPHNDWQALEQLLCSHRHRHRRVLIAIEGVYSMDGDIPYLPTFIQLKQRYKTWLLVDEAHSIGVLGQSGRGIGEFFGVDRTQVDLWMGTLSKSFASCGGYIAGSQALINYLKYTAPGFVYSVGLSPANTAASLAALHKLQQQPERVSTLRSRSQLFLQQAQDNHWNTGPSRDSPIIPLIVGESRGCIHLSQQLGRQGISALPMIYPAVPEQSARLRFFINCTHTKAQIEQTIAVVTAILRESNLSLSS
jgi:myxalamid-type polyketide synthase MxaB